jgi:hypothetical protein
MFPDDTLRFAGSVYLRIGFGIGEEGAGAMAGADILTCQDIDGSGSWKCVDSYASSESQPIPDAQQDWSVVSVEKGDARTTLTVERATDTGDAGQDRALLHDHPFSQLLIFAMGTGANGISYHGTDSRWRQKIKLAGGKSIAEVVNGLEDAAADTFTIRNPELVLQKKATVYHEQRKCVHSSVP